jgi:glutathione S-transferase
LKEIHPLGKSPVVSVQGPGASEPKVIAESALIIEYLSEWFGKWLIPDKFPAGKEGQVGGESEEWLRYRYFMHFAEGSLMPFLVVALVMNRTNASIVQSQTLLTR